MQHQEPEYGYGIELLGISCLSLLFTPLLVSSISNNSTFAKILAILFDGTPLSSEMQSIYDADDNIGKKFLKFSIPTIIGFIGTQFLFNKTLAPKHADLIAKDLQDIRNSPKGDRFLKLYKFQESMASRRLTFIIVSMVVGRCLQYILGAAWAQLFDKTQKT